MRTQQNVRWMTRTAIGLATITLDIKHFKDKEGVEHIDIQQTMTGGIKGTEEKRTLDSVERGHKDHIFGNVVGKTKRCKVEEVEDEYLKTGWETAMVEEGVIDSYVVNKEVDWVAHQVGLIAPAPERMADGCWKGILGLLGLWLT